jgi:hypothetical protein
VKLVWGLTVLMLAIGAVGYWVYRSSPDAQPCSVQVLQALRSPDGRTLAETFDSRCEGAVSTHVSLRAANAPEPARSDVFVAEGSPKVSIQWSDGALRVSSAARPVVVESSWRNIRVVVQQF